MANGVIVPQKSRVYRLSKSSLAFSAGTVIDFGTISTLTDGDYTSGSNLKNMTVINAGGNSTSDFGSLVVSATTQKVFYKPDSTQNGGYVNFVLEFE